MLNFSDTLKVNHGHGTLYRIENKVRNDHFLLQGPTRGLQSLERCVGEGEACLFRGGLRGAAIKLNCCADSKCVFLGNSFTCVATR